MNTDAIEASYLTGRDRLQKWGLLLDNAKQLYVAGMAMAVLFVVVVVVTGKGLPAEILFLTAVTSFAIAFLIEGYRWLIATLEAPAAKWLTAVGGVMAAALATGAATSTLAAATGQEARAAAARALVIRELLLQRARVLDLEPAPLSDAQGRQETVEEALVRQVLEDEAEAISEPGITECPRVYEASKAAFMTPELYEASHLLCAPQSDDAGSWEEARAKAECLLAEIEAGEAFADLARRHSDCPTAAEAGLLARRPAVTAGARPG